MYVCNTVWISVQVVVGRVYMFLKKLYFRHLFQRGIFRIFRCSTAAMRNFFVCGRNLNSLTRGSYHGKKVNYCNDIYVFRLVLVSNEEVLHRVKEERNILHTIKRRKANWIGHILRRNCLLKHVTEGKLEVRIEMSRRRGRRRKQLLDDLNEKRRYWKLKEHALDRTLWRTRFGRGYGPVVRQTTK
jgi:hypothetical protein